MKNYLGELLNSKRQVVKVTGRIVSNPSHLRYVVTTRRGRMQVDATTTYKVGDRVVIFDKVIQGHAGSEPSAVSVDV